MTRFRVGFAVVALAGIAILLVVAGTTQRTLVQSTGVLIISPVAALNTGDVACQRPIVTLAPSQRVSFNPGAKEPTPSLEVDVRDLRAGTTIATGHVGAGFDASRPVTVGLDRSVPAERRIALCVRNTGRTSAALYGDDGHTDLCDISPVSLACRFHFPHPTSAVSGAFVNGKRAPGTMYFALYRGQAASVLSQVPKMLGRATTFRPGFVSPVLWWLLLAGLLLAAPAALLWACRDLGRDVTEPAD